MTRSLIRFSLFVSLISNLAFAGAIHPVIPGHRYFLFLFGAEDRAQRFENTHTWATLVDYDPAFPLENGTVNEGSKTFFDLSISQLPRDRVIDTMRLGPQRARNRNYIESFVHIAKENNLVKVHDLQIRLGQWGPYEMNAEFANLFIHARERLKSGKVWYIVRDFNTRIEKYFAPTTMPFPEAVNCFHAVADSVLARDDRGFLLTGRDAGFPATERVAWHFRPWMLKSALPAADQALERAMDKYLHLDFYRAELTRFPLKPVTNSYCRSLPECHAATAKLVASQFQLSH